MNRSMKAGSVPGALIFTGDQKVQSPDLTVYHFNEERLEVEDHLPGSADILTDEVLWIDIRGLHEIRLVEEVGKMFGLHALAMEDILDIHQRPKFEEYDQAFFLIVRSFTYDKSKLKIIPEQISMYCGAHFVLSFQEDATDIFASVRKRVDQSYGRIRKRGADYLMYALADNIIDAYFTVLDALGDDVEQLEDIIVQNPSPEVKLRIHLLKQCTLDIRRGLSPLREAVGKYSRSESELIDDKTRFFLRDLYDHVLHAMDINETYRDALSGLHDLYISEISFRMNNVMQVLTIIATIFIPLTFFAGIYGMNFDHMPELHYKYSYYILLGAMALITIGLIFFFRRKRWL